MKTYGEKKHFGKPRNFSRSKTEKKQNSSNTTSLNTSKVSVAKTKLKVGMDYFSNSESKQGYRSSSK